MQKIKLFQQLFKYGAVTVLSYIVIILGTYFLVEFVSLQPKISYLIIISFVYIVAYFVYSKLVFQKEINKEQISRFTLVMIIFWFLNNVFYKIFLDFFSIQYLIAAIINIMFLGGIRFVVYRNFVFIK
ncbi:hypothetical protein A2331_02660 [Candidatus Falkowbacteria bacterium RIFOXYB2_FULL_34_18]|uniref:GtrA/DPMS transmembrane domain-containing protein n=1 Tax=Candidatus Falkowbacteria bacterium RIFOXYD2_FULL_34_120 TaxID=1798007 RepID=A0A1F5TSS9_9BACT|nr:MAG: hypothetical protein A2331_02660 [Candidatus Falkowbacteria bacterium RIFOXYB2_FULL_34_18]OGF29642.1 MAG: hypothetical protein A2500_00690 [Candidatus Falkowbacteria bacterium RIFOXYC12_FULL_34_55]OGF37369.1 MAG: hypothetical protein A2466_01460 [Candidatus Falkowbacteria bacterium RIFOXYC2_FULL_34_220]OGF39107.1 MAG: hypothetical protein A2515_00110 [Candidatus Falkowbacteria bacterium RIFOXYD12_FULL_34_57]OGF41631.1 MAG: hypothetical protein A2531_06345 [Candidatus Falkowbacteria bact